MSTLVALLAVAGVLAIATFAIVRSSELFCVSVRDGRLLLVRGRIPSHLLAEFGEAVRDPAVRRGTIIGRRGEAGAELVVTGDVPDGRAQRMRNTFMLVPMAGLRSAPPPSRRTIGQVLGIAWLAWMLPG